MAKIASYLAAAAALLGVCGSVAHAQTPPSIAAAVADPMRPAKDTARDAERKPAEVLAFAGVKPGDGIADIWPGGGYFTRIFAKAVGPAGHVYAYVPTEIVPVEHDPVNTIKNATKDYANVSVLVQPAASFTPPAPLDLAFTAQNYHDLHDKFTGPVDVAAFNRAVFRALKPGGVFLVIDHSAPAGSGLADTDRLHRIDEDVVKTEVEAAGFVLDAESQALRNPADPRTALVFDPSIRGHTDQFMLRFKKPG